MATLYGKVPELLQLSSPPFLLSSSPLQMSNPDEQMGGGEERQLVAPLCHRPSVPLPPISHPPALYPSHHTVSVTVMILIFASSASFAPLHTFPPAFAPPAPSFTIGMTKYAIKLEQIWRRAPFESTTTIKAFGCQENKEGVIQELEP